MLFRSVAIADSEVSAMGNGAEAEEYIDLVKVSSFSLCKLISSFVSFCCRKCWTTLQPYFGQQPIRCFFSNRSSFYCPHRGVRNSGSRRMFQCTNLHSNQKSDLRVRGPYSINIYVRVMLEPYTHGLRIYTQFVR